MTKKSIKLLISMLIIISITLPYKTVFALNMKEVKTDIYNHLINWDTEFEVSYDDDNDQDVIELILNSAAKDDYLKKSLIGLEVLTSRSKLKITAKYRTTKDQEKYISDEIDMIINSLINNNSSDYEKVKAINDYLVKRFEYDTNLQSNNAYLALTTNNTTCQGYSMVAYKMFEKAGIETRMSFGTLDNTPHGWNQVKVNGKWYNIDITNNDSTNSYKFFLKSDTTFMNIGFKQDSENSYEPCYEDYLY